MRKYLRYILVFICVMIMGILYSCERSHGTVEVIGKNDEYGEDYETSTFKNNESETTLSTICVHIAGCVVNPGVYNAPEGSRVYEIIELAGGFTDEADRDYLNQASVLSDGQKVYVYSVGETSTMNMVSGDSAGMDNNGSGLVNINTASKEELMTLTGIGESRAESIIAYREENGGFSSIEDIMKVSGIKEAAYSKIKEYICTN